MIRIESVLLSKKKIPLTRNLNEEKFPFDGGLHDITAALPLRATTDKFDGGSGAKKNVNNYFSCCLNEMKNIFNLFESDILSTVSLKNSKNLFAVEAQNVHNKNSHIFDDFHNINICSHVNAILA